MGAIQVIVAIFTAIAEFMKALVLVIPDMLKLLHHIIQWFQDRKQREIDAQNAQMTAVLQAEQREQALATANLIAFKTLIEDVWQVRYQQILNFLNTNQPEAVLILIDTIDNAKVNAVLVDPKLSNEIKAMRIVNISRSVEQ